VASRGPYRPRSRAAFRSNSTSFGVRYSRGLRSAFLGRVGGTVPFMMFGAARRTTALSFEIREFIFASVPFMVIFGTV